MFLINYKRIYGVIIDAGGGINIVCLIENIYINYKKFYEDIIDGRGGINMVVLIN